MVANKNKEHSVIPTTSEELRELNKTIAKMRSSNSLVFVEVETDERIEIHSHSFDKNAPWFIVPHYSTETDIALRLVSDLPQGHQFVLTVNARGQWKAVFQCRYNPVKDKIAKADTPALAICLAWLSWTDENASKK